MKADLDNFVLASGDSYVRLTLDEEDTSSYAKGDVNLGIDISSAGYSGGNGIWVVDSDFTRFCKDLQELDSSLRGEAILESVSPDELKLRIFAVNSRGGMAVEVSAGSWIETADEMFWHSVKVGFAFEPQQFSKVLALPWIAKRL